MEDLNIEYNLRIINYIYIYICKIMRFQKFTWHNIMRSTKS